MTATLRYIGRMTNTLFELQMRRAARQIVARQHFFPHHVA